MCITYMLFYTAFITKEHFQIFGEMVQKVLIMRSIVDRLLRSM